MVDVKTPLIDAMILWNQQLIGKRVFKISNFEPGRDIEEAIVPSRWD